MAEIVRKKQKIFAGDLSASGNIAVYGSKLGGTPAYSDNLDTIQSARWGNGIMGATSSDKAPYVQDLNAIFYTITKQLAYIFQAGIPEWNSQTEYFAGKSAVLKGGKVYIALQNNTNIQPSVTTGWEDYWFLLNNWGGIQGDITEQADLMTYLQQGLFATCTTAVGTNSKKITINKISDINSIPDGTKISVNFTNGSLSALFDTTLSITDKNGNNKVFSIDLGDNGSTTPNTASFMCAVNGVVEFTLIGSKAICENIVTYTGVNNNVYYRIWRDGYVEQEGRTGGGASGNRNVTLGVIMADTSYCITLSAGIGESSGSTNNTVEAITTSGFRIWSGSPSSYSWRVTGYRGR